MYGMYVNVCDVLMYVLYVVYVMYLIAFRKSAGHREVAPTKFDVHSRWKPAREQKRKEGEEEEERKTKTKP